MKRFITLQLFFIEKVLSGQSFEIARTENGPLKTATCRDILDDDAMDALKLDPFAVFTTAKWVKLQGWIYKKNSVVLLKHSRETASCLPEFGLVEHVIEENGSFRFVIVKLNTVLFNDHFHAFEVELSCPKQWISAAASELPTCEPLWLLQNFGKDSSTKFVCPRHLV